MGTLLLFLQLDAGHLSGHFRDGSKLLRLCSGSLLTATQGQRVCEPAVGAAVGRAGTGGQEMNADPFSADDSTIRAYKA